MRRFYILSIFATVVLPHFASESSAADDSEEIATLIEQLDADRFITRELATEKLLAAERAAIAPLVAKLADANRETLARGTYVLRRLAMSSDRGLGDEAEAGLKKVAASADRQAARQALASLARLNEMRRELALEKLQGLGAVIDTQHVQVGQAIIPNLASLELSEDWKGKPDDLQYLRWLPDIQHVTLNGETINDGCVSHLRHLPNLSIVRLKKAKITDQSMEHLATQKNLQHLAILYCPISDKAVDDLKVHQKVTLLKLYGTGLSAMGADRLQKAMKNTNVDYRQGAFLGIACDPTAMNCFVTYLQPGGAAEQGGLREGDLILKYNGKPAGDFESLTKLIAENRPGEKAKIELMRDGETITKEVELGEWE